MVKRCSAAKCYNSQLTHKVGYFGYPKNELVARAWANLAGRADLASKNLNNLTKYFLCSDHFSREAFVNPDVEDKTFLRLNKSAQPMPSIFEDNLMKNVETVTRNTDKFINYSSQRQEKHQKIRNYTHQRIHQNAKKQNGEQMDAVCSTIYAVSIPTTSATIKEVTLPEDTIEEFVTEEDLEITRTDEYCRLCGSISNELLPIFDNFGLLYKETICLDLMPQGLIAKDDGLPQNVCVYCLVKLQSCVNTIQDFVNNQSLFNSE